MSSGIQSKSGNNFEQAFAKILAKQQRGKIEKRGRPPRQMDLGNTEAGKVQSLGPIPPPVNKDAVGGLNIREIPAHRGHASKAHGRGKTIRKVGVTWR